MQKFQCLLFVLKRSHICYYRICMTVPLNEQGMFDFTVFLKPNSEWATEVNIINTDGSNADNMVREFIKVHRKELFRSGNLRNPAIINKFIKEFPIQNSTKSSIIEKWGIVPKNMTKNNLPKFSKAVGFNLLPLTNISKNKNLRWSLYTA